MALRPRFGSWSPLTAARSAGCLEGAYEFDEVPELPLEGCSRIGGCNAVYEPVLDRYGP